MGRSCHFTPAKAVDDVVVDEPRRLHERVADRRPDEAEAALLQVLAHRLRLSGRSRDIGELLPPIHQRLAVDEAPQVVAQALEFEYAPGVVDRGLDLQAVPNDARIA